MKKITLLCISAEEYVVRSEVLIIYRNGQYIVLQETHQFILYYFIQMLPIMF